MWAESVDAYIEALEARVSELERQAATLERRLEAASDFSRAVVSAQIHPVVYSGEPQITTAEFAALNQVRPQTVRKNYCQTGHYLGIRPTKLKNGRLVWPAKRAE